MLVLVARRQFCHADICRTLAQHLCINSRFAIVVPKTTIHLWFLGTILALHTLVAVSFNRGRYVECLHRKKYMGLQVYEFCILYILHKYIIFVFFLS